MSQKSYIFNPWVWSLSTGLLLSAVYSAQFLQWASLSTAAPANQITMVAAISPDESGQRASYFSHTEFVKPSETSSSKAQEYQALTPSVSLPVQKKLPEIAAPKLPEKSYNPVVPERPTAPKALVTEKAIEQKSSDLVAAPNANVSESVQEARHQPAKVKDKPIEDSEPTLNELLNALVVIEYPEEIVVEFEQDKFSTNLKRQFLTRLILSSQPMDSVGLLKDSLQKSPLDFRRTPHFYQRMLNSSKQPLRYPAQAYSYAKDLLENHVSQIEDNQVNYLQVAIPLHDLRRLVPVSRVAGNNTVELPYENTVKRFSREFSVAQDLIYAVIEVESAFNPKAVSQSNALGLMQIKAGAAGKDVYQYIDGKPGKPQRQELFNPEENIRIGTAYLGLLNDFYFAKVTDSAKKELLVIASYNGGLNKVFQLFGDNETQAIDKINRLPISQVYNRLRLHHPSEETKSYIVKVQKAQKKYRKHLG